MSYKPSTWYPQPTYMDDGTPVMQGPPVMQKSIDASQGWWQQNPIPPEILGDSIINLYMTNIQAFVDNNRRLFQLGLGGVQTRQLTLPGLDIDHDIVQGNETVKLTARPQSYPSGAQMQIENNYDGYIVWAHAETGSPYHGPFALFVNNYLIADNLTISDNANGYVVMFGDTALRCHSLHDKQNPLTTMPGLVNDLSPSLPQLQTPLGAVDNEPGYFLFEWTDALNPDVTDFKDVVTNYGSNGDASTDITFLDGIQFANALDSPLNAKGQNVAYLLPMSNTPSENTAEDYMMAEFYNRDKMVGVQVSWTMTSSAGGTIFANDTPNCFATRSQTYSYQNGGVGLGFDLSVQPNPSGAVLYGQDSLLTEMSPSPPGAPTPGGIQAYNAYLQALIDYENAITAYFQAVAAANAALLAQTAVWEAAYALLGTTYAQAQMSADTTWSNDSTNVIAATTIDGLAQATYQGDPTSGNLGAWQTAAQKLNEFQEAWGKRGAFLGGGLQPSTDYYNDYVTQSDNLYTAKLNYMSAAGTGPPSGPAPTPPTYDELTAGYLGIEAFNYRDVTMTDGLWAFGPWTQGS